MNVILALYRFENERSLDVIMSAFGGESGTRLNWRIPRSVLRAILHLAPSNLERRQRAATFIRDLLPTLATAEAYQRQLMQIQCVLALNQMGMAIPTNLDESAAVSAARRWSVMQAKREI